MRSTFDGEKLLRLKRVLKVREDQEVAAALGMSKAAFSARKSRGSFPDRELYALAQQRPDLGIDVDYVLTGGALTARESTHYTQARQVTEALPLSEAERADLLDKLSAGMAGAAAQNAARQGSYTALLELLNGCTDDSVRLVLALAGRLRVADQAQEPRAPDKGA